MIIYVKSARQGSKQAANLLDLLNSRSAQSVEKRPDESTGPSLYTMWVMDSQRVALENKVSAEFTEWLKEGAKTLKYVEASRMLNRNAWKIQEFKLIPAYGKDPETEWTGLVSFIDNPDFVELELYDDDYRDIVKKLAFYVENLSLGE